MSEPPVRVDSVAYRKIGGWTIETLSWWRSLSTSEQAELIKENRIGFLSSGERVPVAAALQALKDNGYVSMPTTEPVVTSETAPAPRSPDLRLGLQLPWPPASRTRRLYQRIVGVRSSWEVIVVERGNAEKLLADAWDRDPLTSYRWDSIDGRNQLAADLVSDATALEPTVPAMSQLIRPDVCEHVRKNLVDRRLGDTRWEIAAEEICWWLSDEGIVNFA